MISSKTSRIKALFDNQDRKLLSLFFTAGYPSLNSTTEVLKNLEECGVDLVEIGMPFSDPIADGEVIQVSSQKALENGMSIEVLLDQLEGVREVISIPIILMGYYNPVFKYGLEKFTERCAQIGVDGVILPDLPKDNSALTHKQAFVDQGIHVIELVTPQTSERRIREIDADSDGFIYLVSSASTTGGKGDPVEEQMEYFRRINEMKLKNPVLVGFGISDTESFNRSVEYSSGAIVGSAFIKHLEQHGETSESIKQFVRNIRP